MTVGDMPRTPAGARIAEVPDEVLHVRISVAMHHDEFPCKLESPGLYLDSESIAGLD